MNRDESLVMKGVAILLMLFLHLFNQLSNVEECQNLLFIGGMPLVFIMSRATNPVAWFLILGGYGMYKVWLKGDQNRFKRVARLYISYWITLAIFLSIGHLMFPEKYPGSIQKLFENITGYASSYNGEMWFLLPYVMLALLSPYYFKWTSNIKVRYIIISTFILSLATSYIISRYGSTYLYRHQGIYDFFLIFHLLFNFTLGAMAARCDFFEKLKDWSINHNLYHRKIVWGGVFILFATACFFKYLFGYAFFMISLILITPRASWIDNILKELGKKSMDMWFVHTWFCYYLFHDFIYSFRYPPLIFLVLTIISYVSAIVIGRISEQLTSRIPSLKKANPII